MKRYNALSARIPNTKRVTRFKLGYSLIVSQNGLAGVQFPQILLPLNFPNLMVNDNGVGTAVLSAIPTNPFCRFPDLYTALFNNGPPLFDQYKVNKLTARFIANTLDVNTTNTIGSGLGNLSLSIYHLNDQDDITLHAPATAEQHYLNAGILPKSYNNTSSKGVTYVYKQHKEAKRQWINTGLVAANAVPTPITNQTYGSGGFPSMFGSMKLMWMCNNATAVVQNIGRLFVEWDVSFKGVNSVL